MCRKLILLICFIGVLGLVDAAEGLEELLKIDVGYSTSTTEPGFFQIGPAGGSGSAPEPFIVSDVCDTGINIILETTYRRIWGDSMLGFRDNGFHPLFGDLVHINDWFGYGIILTLSGLSPGTYTVESYHNNIWTNPAPVSNLNILVDEQLVLEDVPQSRTQTGPFASTSFAFEIQDGEDSVEIQFLPTGEPPDCWDNVALNAFILYSGGILGKVTASEPEPAYLAENVCPENLLLSWEPGVAVDTHSIYFSTDVNDVTGPSSAPVETNWGPNTWPAPNSLQWGTIYYWRVDEVNDSNTWTGAVWQFTANAGKAFDPSPGDNERGSSAIDAALMWEASCLASSHDVYFGTAFGDINDANSSNIGSYPNVDYNNVATGSYELGSIEPFTRYYWRVDEIVDGNAIKGDVWTFRTGLGGVILYYQFDDGSVGQDFPSQIIDSTGNVTFTKYIDGNDANSVLEYGVSNPVYNSSGRSADFTPRGALYRRDPCGPDDIDILRLDGYQYSIEMWVCPDSLDDASLIEKDDTWSIVIDDGEIEYWHAGDDDRWNVVTAVGYPLVEGQWYHIGAVFNFYELPRNRLYIDGGLAASRDACINNYGDPLQNPPDSNVPVGIGCRAYANGNFGAFFDGRIDELRIQDLTLGPCEFLVVPGPEWASCPSPFNGQSGLDPCDPNLALSWIPGIYADKHDIYFGTTLAAVGGSATPYVQNHESNSWTPPAFEFGRRYFWRVDEKDDDPCADSPWEGMVWRFTTKFEVTDPNLKVWYPFDEPFGTIAMDYSGHSYDGIVDGPGDGWDPNGGKFDGCRIFDNDTHVRVPMQATGRVTSGVSILVWLNGDQRQSGDMVVFDSDTSETAPLRLRAIVPDSSGDVIWRAGNDTNDRVVWDTASPKGWGGEWHHLAFIKDEDAGTMTIYFDALLADSKTGTINSLASAVSGTRLKIGAYGWHGSEYEGKMDDFRIYECALSAQDVAKVFRGGDLELAWAPSPYHGRTDTPYDANLIWRPGDYAADPNAHEVYFGTNWDDVNDANNSWPVGTSVYKGSHNFDANNYDPPGSLDLGQTYYWRIDEVNDTSHERWRGSIWRFTVADYITIADMEDYDEIWDGWWYGSDTLSNSELSLWTTSPLRGEQTMKFTYDNSIPFEWWYFSEAETVTLAPNNWTLYDLRVLSLWFYGESDNADTGIEPMYVYLEDNSYNSAMVKYGDGEGEHPNDIAVEEWQNWEIFTSSLNDANLASLRALCIGFGEDRFYPVEGGWGAVYFDDIRLYQPTCVPWRRKPAADISNNCIVDWEDIEIMANDWLDSDVNLGQVTKPDANGLVGWWKLDEPGSPNATDYAGYDNNGVIETLDDDVWWVAAGHDGNALEFDGGRVLVPDAQVLRPTDQVTACAWVKFDYSQEYSARIVCKGPDNKETFSLEVGSDDKFTFLVRDGNDPNAADYPDYAVDSNELDRGKWVHLAGTYDGNSIKCYVNGSLEGTNNDANAVVILSQDTNDLAIGNRSDATNRSFIGTIDDVRVYDYALSLEEVRYIATDGTKVFSVQSIANIYNAEALGQRIVNFRDFAVIADSWLEKKLWPE